MRNSAQRQNAGRNPYTNYLKRCLGTRSFCVSKGHVSKRNFLDIGNQRSVSLGSHKTVPSRARCLKGLYHTHTHTLCVGKQKAQPNESPAGHDTVMVAWFFVIVLKRLLLCSFVCFWRRIGPNQADFVLAVPHAKQYLSNAFDAQLHHHVAISHTRNAHSGPDLLECGRLLGKVGTALVADPSEVTRVCRF